MHSKTVVAGGWSAVAIAAMASLLPTPSSACVLLLDGPQQTNVTADGTLLFAFSCTPGVAPCAAGQTPPFHVEDAAGHTLTGTVVKSGGLATGVWIAWKPEHAFAPNVNYHLKGDLDGFNNEVVLDSGTAAAFDPTTLQLSFSAEKSSVGAGDTVCCKPSPQTMFCYGRQPCFQEQRQEVVALAVRAEGTVQPTGFQHLYRVTVRADGAATTLPDQLAPDVDYELQTPAQQYCYSVDAINPLTDALVHVSDGCKTLGITTLGVRAPTDAEHQVDLSVCADTTLFKPDASVGTVSADAGSQPAQPDAGTIVPDAGSSSTHAGDGGAIAPGGKPTPSDDDGCAVSRRFDLGYALALLVLALRTRKKQHA